MNAAKKDLDNAQAAKDAAQKEADSAAASKAAAEKAVTDAQNAASEAVAAANQKSADYDNAKAAYDAVVAAVPDKKAEYDAAKAAYDPAKAAYDEAKSAYDASNQAKTDKYNEYKKDIADYKEAAAAVPDVQNHNSDEFFKDMGSNDAYGKLTGKNIDGTSYSGKRTDAIQSETHLDSETDASSIKNMAYAIAQIESVNNLRESVGLNRLQISDYYMAWEQSNVNWSDNNMAHSSGCGAENLAWGCGDPSLGWYYEEKAIFDEFYEYKTGNKCELVGADAYAWYQANIVGKSDYSKWLNANHAGETVGHYTNFINPNYNYIGMAYTDQGTYGDTWGQSLSRSAVGEGYTEAQYKERFVNWLAETYQKDGMSAADAQKAAKAIMTQAEKAVKINDDATDYTQIAKQMKTDKAAMDSAKASLDAVQPTYESAKASYDAVSGDISAKEQARDAALKEKENAESKVAEANDAMSSAQMDLHNATESNEAYQKELYFANQKLDTAQKAYDEAAKDYQTTAASNQKLIDDVNATKAGLDQAEQNKTEANNSLATAKQNLSDAQTAAANAEVADKNAQQAAQNAAKNTAAAQNKYSEAMAAQAAAQEEYDRLNNGGGDNDNASDSGNGNTNSSDNGGAGNGKATGGSSSDGSSESGESRNNGGVTGSNSSNSSGEQANKDANAVDSFVSRLYTEVLDRQPDDKGKTDQVNALTSGTAPAEIAYNYFNSAEYKAKDETAEQTVERIYQVMFGRAADASGKAMWVGYLDGGMSVRAVIAGFSQSDEYKAYFASMGVDNSTIAVTEARDKNPGVTGFCGRLYTQCLGRIFDADGINAQAGAILDGMSASQIAVNFFTSSEFSGLGLSNDQIVERCYQTMMGRASDADGKAFWLGQMASGMSVEDLVRGFAQSVEWTNICTDYGVVK